MKTLKQILESDEYYGKIELWDYQTIIKSLKEWLQQKRGDIGNKIYSDSRVVAETIFDELSEELEEKH